MNLQYKCKGNSICLLIEWLSELIDDEIYKFVAEVVRRGLMDCKGVNTVIGGSYGISG